MDLTLTRVYDKFNNLEVPLNDICIKQVIAQSSNTKIPVYRIFIKDKIVKKNNSYIAEYKCVNCSRLNIVALNNIVRKMNKGIKDCNTCKNNNPEKVRQHSEFMKSGGVKREETLCPMSLLQRLEIDQKSFDMMDDDFKSVYFQKHLTYDEFERIKLKIVDIHNGKINNINDFVYYPCVKISNQTLFNPYLYDTKRDVIEPIRYITFTCESCDNRFCNRDLYIQKNRYKVYCKDCSFTNKTFKIRHYKIHTGAKIMYQSKFELKLASTLDQKGVVIQNGPNIPYVFQGKQHKYRVDFFIPKLGMLIECKDNHQWHRQNCETGKWQCKENAAQNYAKQNNLEFIMVFPRNFMSFIESVVNKI